MYAQNQIQQIYQGKAGRYDLDVRLYRLLGIRIADYRSRVVDLLRPGRGNVVVELGCGTGANFPLLIERIGPEGRLIGVDLTPEMLARAEERVQRAGWRNVELHRSDIAAYDLPKGVNRVLSTGVFGYVAEYDRVIRQAARALTPSGRMVILDVKRPERWPGWLLRLFVWFFGTYGLSGEYFTRRAWESMERCLEEVTFEEMYGGAVYIAAGTAPAA